jgi:predicted DNA-binding transcriptional regulator AlpA
MKVTTDVAFLTPEEMAAKLRISIRKLQKMVKEGTAPKHLRLGSRLVFVVGREARHD